MNDEGNSVKKTENEEKVSFSGRLSESDISHDIYISLIKWMDDSKLITSMTIDYYANDDKQFIANWQPLYKRILKLKAFL